MNESVLKQEERAVFSLRELYEKYGYSQFKMSKFEEYDLYVKNKDFLVSDNIITFTDTNGKLMALKPDVTLSIIKNSKDEKACVQKLYYNENVYRVSKSSHSFKEIMQTGLECIGDIDDYCIFEVIMLAAKSLESISDNYVLDISHLNIISTLIDSLGISAKSDILKCISEKNISEIGRICQSEDVDAANLIKLVSSYGSTDKMLPILAEIKNEDTADAIEQLERIITLLEGVGLSGKVRIDFSVMNDVSYYNGFVFKGFIEGIASGVLSGGQYDKLMKKMGKKSRAIGFAVYLDELERLSAASKCYDVDTVILYDEESDINALNSAAAMLRANGTSVTAQKSIPENIRYKQLVRLVGKGVEIVGTNA